jgi:hypothetical protein
VWHLSVYNSALDRPKQVGHCEVMATELLKQAFEEAAKLPEFEQDALANALLGLVSGDAGWDDLLAKTQDKLARLADRALKESDPEPLDPDKL